MPSRVLSEEERIAMGLPDADTARRNLTAADESGIAVPDDDVIPANFDSVNNLAAYIDRKQGS